VVELFIASPDAFHYRQGLGEVGRLYENLLESPLQRTVLFNDLAVFVERCSSDALDLASGEGRLEEVRRV
jgi:Protein of unknown function (DUF3170).